MFVFYFIFYVVIYFASFARLLTCVETCVNSCRLVVKFSKKKISVSILVSTVFFFSQGTVLLKKEGIVQK